MADHDNIRSGLNDVAASIDVGDLELARAGVRSTAQKRRMRTRAAVSLGAVVALVAGAAVVVAVSGSDEPDTLVSADPTVVETTATTEPVASTIEPQPAAGTRTVEVIDRPGVVGAVAGAGGVPEYAEWAVPWRDGFLAGGSVYAPQPLPDRLPEEVRALFPQEVLDLFVDGLPATIDEATEMLSEAGLLDEVSTVISEHPEASAAIYGDPVATPPTLEARFTTDGVTWEPVEMTLPPGATYTSGVAGVGDRLTIVYSEQANSPEFARPDRFTVATTTDLTTWTTQEVVPPTPPVELPAGIQRNVNAQGLVATESGWAVTVYDSIDPDPLELLRAAGMDPPFDERSGFGMGFDETGMELQYSDDPTASDFSETARYTWDELGVEPDVAEYLSGANGGPQTQTQVWASTWDGAPARANLSSVSGQLVATSAGFLQWTDQTWFSPDGVTWTSSPLPDPDGQVTAAFAYDGGVIALSTGADQATDVFRLDETGGVVEGLDVPGLPTVVQGGQYSQAAPGSALVVDAGVPPAQPGPLIVDVDGYRLTSENGRYELSDVATGEVIVSESFLRNPPADDSNFDFGLDGLTVTDPETGEVLVVVPNDVFEQAMQDLYGDSSDTAYVPDLWLIGSSDGERFIVADLDDGDDGDNFGGPISVTTNGNRVLVQTGDGWSSYDLS